MSDLENENQQPSERSPNRTAEFGPPPSGGWKWQNSYLQLPEKLYRKAKPEKVPNPEIALLNQPLAAELGLDWKECSPDQLANLFAGHVIPAGIEPLAQAYAGHQFGGFTVLGDGRAILLGEHQNPQGTLVDVHLKGSGKTPFSRRGDGKASLGPMLREYLISESMHALSIPTTRSLAVVTTGEKVYRETVQPGAILTRIAKSHIRIGTFQLLMATQDNQALERLFDYTVERLFPELLPLDRSEQAIELLRMVIDRQASLIAKWQSVGFIHGVMNTDNMLLSGETIDYGPCAFLDRYHPETVFSSIDSQGRYAYINQPAIAQWNLARFAETLLGLISADPQHAVKLAMEQLEAFPSIFSDYWMAAMRKKLGLQNDDAEDKKEDNDLIEDLLKWMETSESDFTRTFRDLSEQNLSHNELYQSEPFQDWLQRWQNRLPSHPSDNQHPSPYAIMKSVNPSIIPRNFRVEEALAAAHRGDLQPTLELLAAIQNPYSQDPSFEKYRELPPAGFCDSYCTFCGT